MVSTVSDAYTDAVSILDHSFQEPDVGQATMRLMIGRSYHDILQQAAHHVPADL
jgi:hypothetical protein